MIHDFGIVWGERCAAAERAGQHGDPVGAGRRSRRWCSALLLTPALMSRQARRSPVPRAPSSTAMRCIPFLLFAYIVYYGLPSLGLRLRQLELGPGGADRSTTPPTWPRSCAAPGPRSRASRSKPASPSAFPDFAAVPPHHPAAAAAVGRAGDRQPDDPDHQGQRLPHHHRLAGADPCRELDPVAALCSVRGVHHGGSSLLGPLPGRRGRRGLRRPPGRGAALGRWHDDQPTRSWMSPASPRALAISRCCPTSASRSARAKPSACSAPRARANRRCLRCINWLERPDAGQIYLDGKQIGVTARAAS